MGFSIELKAPVLLPATLTLASCMLKFLSQAHLPELQLQLLFKRSAYFCTTTMLVPNKVQIATSFAQPAFTALWDWLFVLDSSMAFLLTENTGNICACLMGLDYLLQASQSCECM